jgi:hypothetical protein
MDFPILISRFLASSSVIDGFLKRIQSKHGSYNLRKTVCQYTFYILSADFSL